jgi:hypothetical protein
MAQDPEVRVRRAALRALSAPQALADLPAAERRKALREILRGQAEPNATPTPTATPTSVTDEAVTDEPVTDVAAAQLDLDAIDRELRSSLRGRTPEQLARLTGVETETLNRALQASPSRFVLRGPRWFAT